MYLNIKDFFQRNKENKDFYSISKMFELEKHEKFNNAKSDWVFFTNKETIKNMLSKLHLPDKDTVTILEPSVWSWNFVPLIIDKFSKKYKKVKLYINDIDNISLDFIKWTINNNILNIPSNVEITYLNKDFLKDDFKDLENIDFIIWNPPYWKIPDLSIKKLFKNNKTNNMFAFFIEKSIRLASNISFIVPKWLLYVKQFDFNRSELYNGIYQITDYWKKAFDVNLETISFSYSKKNNDNIIIEDYINKIEKNHWKKYIMNKEFPIWLIYRNEKFDKILNKLKYNIFTSFRDRQITNKFVSYEWKYQVLKWRNIDKDKIINIDWYDQFITDIDNIKVSKFLNKKNILCIPNLTNKIRTCLLPKNTLVNWAVALIYKKDFWEINKKQ